MTRPASTNATNVNGSKSDYRWRRGVHQHRRLSGRNYHSNLPSCRCQSDWLGVSESAPDPLDRTVAVACEPERAERYLNDDDSGSDRHRLRCTDLPPEAKAESV